MATQAFVNFADARRASLSTGSEIESRHLPHAPGAQMRAPRISGPRLPERELVLRGVSKSYRLGGRDLAVLNDINMTVEPGQFITIVGSSGCGKSTLLRLIAGLESDFSGEILMGGSAIVGPGLERGIVFQDHRLFPWLTVEENVALAFESRRLESAVKQRLVREHLALVGLAGFEKAYPYQLSGGMAQRTAIARALVNEPEILLLDEPLAAVDALTRYHLQNELQRIWQRKGVTIIMVTHDIEEALYLGEKVVVLQPRPGRIRRTIELDLPHPRDREDARLLRLKREILNDFTADLR